MKLLADSGLEISKINSDAPYVIMFGPDKCGTDDMVWKEKKKHHKLIQRK